MPVWSAADVAGHPNDVLTQWAIFELPNGDRHLAGYSTGLREGRATSTVVEFDMARLKAVTASGRVYTLKGRPGLSGDGEYVWRRWCSLNAVSSCEDISPQVLAEHEAALAAAPNKGIESP